MSEHKNITEPDLRGFQVRVVRDRKEYSRYFSHKSWGSKKKSLQAAISWREQCSGQVNLCISIDIF